MDGTDDGAVAILLAAGEGRRLGRGELKAFIPLAGRPMVWHSLVSIVRSGVVGRAVLVVPESEVPRAGTLAEVWDERTLLATVVAGGETRQASVQRGLESLATYQGPVLCHDAARPLASPELFRRVLAGLAEADGAVPVVPLADTVKRVAHGRVVETLPREQLVLAQTPQAFRAEALRDAHRRARARGLQGTDDSMLVEAAGYAVATVDGEPWNFKVTLEEDLARADRMLSGRLGVPGGANG